MPSGGGFAESIDDFMARRRREVDQLNHDAEAAGHAAWRYATRTGEQLLAATPRDVRVLGARALAAQPTSAAAPKAVSTAAPGSKAAASASPYGALPTRAPDSDELAELRRQQAAFAKSQGDVDRQFSWMAVPALAPVAAAMLAEGIPLVASRFAASEAAEAAPLQFTEREPFYRVGDNWATRAGRRAHQALKERLAQKPNWDYEPRVRMGTGELLKPDVGTPVRQPDPLEDAKRFYMELKPNTASGRRAAAKAVERYSQGGRKVRAIFYDPADFI